MRSQRFDPALVDSKMPETRGRETINEIRKLDPQLPVLLAAGYPEWLDTELRAATR